MRRRYYSTMAKAESGGFTPEGDQPQEPQESREPRKPGFRVVASIGSHWGTRHRIFLKGEISGGLESPPREKPDSPAEPQKDTKKSNRNK